MVINFFSTKCLQIFFAPSNKQGATPKHWEKVYNVRIYGLSAQSSSQMYTHSCIFCREVMSNSPSNGIAIFIFPSQIKPVASAEKS